MDVRPEAPRVEVGHFEMYSLGQQGVYWRLLSANNRNSGQSGCGFPDVGACRSAIDRMLSLLSELRPQYTLTPDHRWHWTLALNDEVLARSSRSFDRRLRCVAASQWFMRAAPNASIRTALRIGRGHSPDQESADLRGPLAPPPDLPPAKGGIAGLGGLAGRELGRPGRPGVPGQPEKDRNGR
jgi:hypothetical protein